MFQPFRFTRVLALGAALAALTATGCGNGNSTTSPSGTGQVVIVDLVVGTGATAAKGNLVSVDYTGWYYDASKPDGKGTQFDTSAGRGPLTFVLGTGAVIQGFDQGVTGMKVGGQRRVTIPPGLAYGTDTLVFEITLLSVS